MPEPPPAESPLLAELLLGEYAAALNDQPVPDRRDAAALAAIIGKSPVLYINILGESTIELPLGGAERCPFPLRSDRARSSLCATICREAGFIPFDQEINRLLWILEDVAWKDVRCTVPFDAAIEQHDLIEAIEILLRSPTWRNGYDGTCEGLRALLNDVASKHGIDVRQKDWPKSAARLSNQLTTLAPTLLAGGIGYERGRSNGVRWIKLRRGDASAATPLAASLERPCDNSLVDSSLSCDDERVDDSLDVMRRIRTPTAEDAP